MQEGDDSRSGFAGMGRVMADPVEKTKELVEEADEGASDQTPLIIFTGVPLIIGAVVGVVLIAAFLVYFLV